MWTGLPPLAPRWHRVPSTRDSRGTCWASGRLGWLRAHWCLPTGELCGSWGLLTQAGALLHQAASLGLVQAVKGKHPRMPPLRWEGWGQGRCPLPASSQHASPFLVSNVLLSVVVFF